MMRRPRLQPRPETVIALLALFFALGGSALAVGEHVQGTLVAQKRCANGSVRGIAAVTGIPSQGIANLPGNFTGSGAYFGRRFNCTGRAVQARRVEAGVFEVRFVGRHRIHEARHERGQRLIAQFGIGDEPRQIAPNGVRRCLTPEPIVQAEPIRLAADRRCPISGAC